MGSLAAPAGLRSQAHRRQQPRRRPPRHNRRPRRRARGVPRTTTARASAYVNRDNALLRGDARGPERRGENDVSSSCTSDGGGGARGSLRHAGVQSGSDGRLAGPRGRPRSPSPSRAWCPADQRLQQGQRLQGRAGVRKGAVRGPSLIVGALVERRGHLCYRAAKKASGSRPKALIFSFAKISSARCAYIAASFSSAGST